VSFFLDLEEEGLSGQAKGNDLANLSQFKSPRVSAIGKKVVVAHLLLVDDGLLDDHAEGAWAVESALVGLGLLVLLDHHLLGVLLVLVLAVGLVGLVGPALKPVVVLVASACALRVLVLSCTILDFLVQQGEGDSVVAQVLLVVHVARAFESSGQLH
jgi:hypothetical protein